MMKKIGLVALLTLPLLTSCTINNNILNSEYLTMEERRNYEREVERCGFVENCVSEVDSKYQSIIISRGAIQLPLSSLPPQKNSSANITENGSLIGGSVTK